MKKIIYSIVTALVLSVLLTLIFPTWFLKEDARWTFLSGVACVDISFVGNLTNGRVKVESNDTIITQPKWSSSSKNSFQGTVVECPVSYRTKPYQIKLTPQADEWGKDATLIIKFRGEDFQYGGKRKSAWVIFRNIKLNGQPVATEKAVWHDRPFLLQYPHHSSKITLTFDVHKPLKASDFAILNLLVTFFTFLLLNLFLTPLKRAVNWVLEPLNRKDIVRVLAEGYAHIDPVYRRSFWVIFGVLCFAFGFHTIYFMWGNHDWFLLEFQHRWLSYTETGRYMLFSVKSSFLHGVYLPLVYDIITFVAMAINAVLLCRYWRLEKQVIYYVLCGLVLTVQPFTFGMLYFAHLIPEVLIGVTCVLVALPLSEKIALLESSVTKKIIYSLIAIVLINVSLAMYPVLINTIAVTFIGRLLILSFDWDSSWQQLKSGMKPVITATLATVLGITSYKLILTFVFPPVKLYNTEMLPIRQLPERLGILFKQCFHQLYEYNFPFITQWVLWIFLGFTILLTFYVCFTGDFKQKIVRLILLFGSLFGTQTVMIIAKTHVIADRVELFGLVFFEVLTMVLVFTRLRKLRNISVVLGTCIVFASVINDLDCLRVWKLGFDAEKMLWNRVLARLEIQKDFDPSRKYDVVQVGHPISIRPRFYTGQKGKHIGDAKSILYFSYDTDWVPFRACAFYYPTRFHRKSFTAYYGNKEYESRLKLLYQAGVLQKAEVWPKPNGLIVWKDIILFVIDGKELERYKKQFEREFGKK